MVKNLPANAGGTRDASLIPGLGRSPGGGSNNPLQYSYLKNSLGRGAWCAAACGIAAHAYTHTDLKVCADDEVTWKRSGVWNGSSGPQEQGLPVKQVPGVWSGGR